MAKSQLMYNPDVINTFRVLAKSERQRLGIKQVQMADDLGISVSAVSMIENGDRPFSHDMAERVNNYLKLNYPLPKPNLKNTRERNKNTSPLIQRHSFVIELDGEAVEVLSYRKLGPIKKARMSDG